MLNEDEIDPKLCAQLLTRREEAEGGRVDAVHVVARLEAGPAELLVLAACVETRRRDDTFARFPRVALALQAGSFVRLVTVRPNLCARVAEALLEAPAVADELTARARSRA